MKKPSFRSGFEEVIYDSLVGKGVDVHYEPQSFPYIRKVRSLGICLTCGGKQIGKRANYTPDFRIGTGIFLETKGYFNSAGRARMVDFIEEYDGKIDLRFIFGSDNRIKPTSDTRYSDWAKKYKVKFAIGEVPDAWIKEARKQVSSRRNSLRKLRNTTK